MVTNILYSNSLGARLQLSRTWLEELCYSLLQTTASPTPSDI